MSQVDMFIIDIYPTFNKFLGSIIFQIGVWTNSLGIHGNGHETFSGKIDEVSVIFNF